MGHSDKAKINLDFSQQNTVPDVDSAQSLYANKEFDLL